MKAQLAINTIGRVLIVLVIVILIIFISRNTIIEVGTGLIDLSTECSVNEGRCEEECGEREEKEAYSFSCNERKDGQICCSKTS